MTNFEAALEDALQAAPVRPTFHVTTAEGDPTQVTHQVFIEELTRLWNNARSQDRAAHNIWLSKEGYNGAPRQVAFDLDLVRDQPENQETHRRRRPLPARQQDETKDLPPY